MVGYSVTEKPEGYYVLSKPVKRGETPSYTYLGPDLEGGSFETSSA